VKVLVVDDHAVNRLIITIPLKDMGYECVEAENGERALEQFVSESPDLVLMDVIMPVMDGYEATERIKRMAGNRHVPIIFLTAKSDEKSLAKCIECGGDDFLQKPVNPNLLKSKIDAHMRINSLMLELQQKNMEISALHETLQQEHETGRHVLSHSLSRNWNECPNLRCQSVPQSIFNGDIMLSAPKPLGGLYVLLGDITGHGLAAAMGSVPLSQTFFAMTAKGKPISAIIRELNRAIHEFLPRSMFCAALLLEMDVSGRAVRLWSGGVPLAFVLRKHGKIEDIESEHVPLGILGPSEFNNTLTDLELSHGDSILLMTDGIHEAINVDGDMLGEDKIREIVRIKGNESFDEILETYESFVAGCPQIDDVTIIQLDSKPMQIVEKERSQGSRLPWKASIALENEQLRNVSDPVMQVVSLMPPRLELAVHQERISTVLAELYNNALEHGILGLKSDMKHGINGFEEYYRLRRERLEKLDGGSISIELDYDPVKRPKLITLTIRDSGEGFDWEGVQRQSADKSYGRGLALVKSLCQSLEFLQNGSKVVAEIPLE
jgi:CheY-like chemotaxis protein/anti-sigma regulatory factor (Ser/Thr protein kinase)